MSERFSFKLVWLITGLIIGVLGMVAYSSFSGVSPKIIEGYSSGTNFAGTAIGISKELGGGGDGYSIAGARWREFDGPWHDNGSPPSLAWPSYGQKIRIGLVEVKATGDAPGTTVVVWLEVLSPSAN